MTNFEYQLVVWDNADDGTTFLAQLNAGGAEGWELVGLAPRAASVKMPGMGARAVSEMAALLKRASRSE